MIPLSATRALASGWGASGRAGHLSLAHELAAHGEKGGGRAGMAQAPDRGEAEGQRRQPVLEVEIGETAAVAAGDQAADHVHMLEPARHARGEAELVEEG